MILGVFDSGIGGEAIAISLQAYFPDAKIITVNDSKNVPYGNKTNDEIIFLTDQAIQPLLKSNCDAIVIACNTATAIAIEILRSKYPKQKFIGIEPMIKTASKLSKTQKIAVCATPATLSSKRYNNLKNKFGLNLSIVEPDCSNWAKMIECNNINYQLIKNTIDKACDDGADVIVLGCTHYHWIKDEIVEITAGRARVIEPSEAIGKRIADITKNQL